MAVSNHCFNPILGKMMRATPLNSCGVVPDGAEYVATDGFITVSLSSEVEDGTEIIVKKANGSLCVNEKAADSFKRFTAEIHFCGVNPALLSIVSNAEPYVNAAGDTIGFTVPEGEIKKWFALEVWTGLTGGVCEPGAEEESGYMLLPFLVGGVLGDLEIGGEDAIDFSITGAATKGGNGWAEGPYDVISTAGMAGPLDVPLDPFDHLLLIDTTLAPPPDSCDPVPVPGGVTATGATAGTPGTFTPAGASAPATADIDTLTASPVTAWTTGQYVSASNGDKYHWDGDSWETGTAP